MALVILDSLSLEYPVFELKTLKKQFAKMRTGGELLMAKKNVIVKALDNVSLRIEHGDRVGLVGHNGAGKSTLLRVIADIYEPTSGRRTVDGQISTLLDVSLKTGDDLTGYESILLKGILLGMTRKEIEAKSEEIAEFTELGDYLSMPMRTYSDGMRLRLAFGVATSLNPEILLIDEIVGAGDAAFKISAKARLNELIDKSSIVVMASHFAEVIRGFCNKVLILDGGKLIFYGPVEEGLAIHEGEKTAA